MIPTSLRRTTPHPIFRVEVPVAVPGVPDEVLIPRNTWPDAAEYDAAARRIATMFHENFARFEHLEPEVAAGGPLV